MYRYLNVDIDCRSILHVLSEDASGNGNIGWQNQDDTLPLRGHFQHSSDNTVVLAFDDGNGRAKSARLFKTDENVWEGYDYDGRWVRITKLKQVPYCTECKLWHLMHGPGDACREEKAAGRRPFDAGFPPGCMFQEPLPAPKANVAPETRNYVDGGPDDPRVGTYFDC